MEAKKLPAEKLPGLGLDAADSGHRLVWTQGSGHQQTCHCSKYAQTFTVPKLGCPRAEVLLPLVWADVWPNLGYIMN